MLENKVGLLLLFFYRWILYLLLIIVILFGCCFKLFVICIDDVFVDNFDDK